MGDKYEIDKWIWSESDFETMGWHDCKVYAIGFDKDNYKLMLDVDYIFKWVKPKENDIYYKFWVSPATLVFENVYNLSIETSGELDIQINSITRSNPKKPRNLEYIKKATEWEWIIELTAGDISFISVGYHQFIKKSPILSKSQSLEFSQRDRITFSTYTYFGTNVI